MKVTSKASFTLLIPEDGSEKKWLDDNLETQPYQWSADMLVIDRRLAPSVVERIQESGLPVTIEDRR